MLMKFALLRPVS